MSKILFLANWPYNTRFETDYYGSHSYFEGLKNSFNNANHDVLHINLLNFGGVSTLDENNNPENHLILTQKITSFNPDLIIAFNNQITKKIYEITNCPVLVWWCDDPSYIDCHGNQYIQKYRERIYFGVFSDNQFEYIKSTYAFDKNRILLTKPSTGFYKKDIKQDKSITYVGSVYTIPDCVTLDVIQRLSKNRVGLYTAFNKLQYNLDDKEGNEFFKQILQKEDIKNDVAFISSYYQKTQTLIALASFFDLHIYSSSGTYSDLSIPAKSNLDLMVSHHIDELCNDIDDVANIYNSSKISINLNTSYANKGDKGGLSWRVCDVMATNSCLISNISPALDQCFGKWVKIPQFTTKQEAYDISKNILAEYNWRQDIVAGSQLAIKEGGFTFDCRVRELEQLFNLKKGEPESKYEFFINPALKIKKKKVKKIRKIFKKVKKIFTKNA